MEQHNLLRRNYGDGQDPAILALACSMTGVMLVTFFTRVYVRWRYSGIRKDDWAHVVPCCLATGATILVGLGVGFGTGRRGYTEASGAANGLKWSWISNLLFVLAVFTVKLAISISLLRLVRWNRILRIAVFGVMLTVVTYTVVAWVPSVLECVPLRVVYDKTGMTGNECLPQGVMEGLEMMHSVMDAGTNVVLLVLSGVGHSGRVVGRKARYGLGVVFVLGFVAAGAGIVRSAFVFRDSWGSDVLYNPKILPICAITEINLGIIASCTACLRPLLSWRRTTVIARTDRTSMDDSEKAGYDLPSDTCPAAPPAVAVKDAEFRHKGMVMIEIGDEVHPAFRQRGEPLRWMTPVDEEKGSDPEP